MISEIARKKLIKHARMVQMFQSFTEGDRMEMFKILKTMMIRQGDIPMDSQEELEILEEYMKVQLDGGRRMDLKSIVFWESL